MTSQWTDFNKTADFPGGLWEDGAACLPPCGPEAPSVTGSPSHQAELGTWWLGGRGCPRPGPRVAVSLCVLSGGVPR